MIYLCSFHNHSGFYSIREHYFYVHELKTIFRVFRYPHETYMKFSVYDSENDMWCRTSLSNFDYDFIIPSNIKHKYLNHQPDTKLLETMVLDKILENI